RIVFILQAEDGIRDFHVTGVQTCALPIWIEEVVNALRRPSKWRFRLQKRIGGWIAGGRSIASGIMHLRCTAMHHPTPSMRKSEQIGRASCRERAESRRVAEAYKSGARCKW